MASNLLAMARWPPTPVEFCPDKIRLKAHSNGLQPTRDGLQSNSDGLQPGSSLPRPNSVS